MPKISIKCPHCHSDNVHTRGTKTRIQFTCGDCGKWFSPKRKLDNPPCPHCKSKKTYKHTSYDKKKRFRCQDCNKTYYEPKKKTRKKK